MTKEHLEIEEVGRMAERAHEKSVILYHWVRPNDPASFVARVPKYYSGAAFASAGFQRYCLPAAPPPGKSGVPGLHLSK